MTETPPPCAAPGPEPEAPEPTVDLQAEVERLLAENEALQFSEAEAHDAVERLAAELARAGGPPPDGEMRRTVKWWRVLSEDERERYEWRLPVEARRWCKSDPSHFGDHCVIYVRERPTPEPPPVEAGQWRASPSGCRFLLLDVSERDTDPLADAIHKAIRDWAATFGRRDAACAASLAIRDAVADGTIPLRSLSPELADVIDAAVELTEPWQWDTVRMFNLRNAVMALPPDRKCIAEGHLTMGPDGPFHDPDEGPCEYAVDALPEHLRGEA